LAQDHYTDPLQAVDPLNWHLRKAEARAYLNDVGDRLQQAGIVAEVVVLEGSPVDRIVEFARIWTVTNPLAGAGYRLSYRYGRSVYDIEVDNTAGVKHDVKEVYCDGILLENGRILLQDDGQRHCIQVVMG
jgi:hypothetical protein